MQFSDKDSKKEDLIEPDSIKELMGDTADEADAHTPPPLGDDKTEAAVDDIAEKESDAVLAAEDEQVQKAFVGKPGNLLDKLKDFLHRWWDNPKARYGTLAGVGVLLLLLIALPPTRYFMLNTAGVRGSTSLTVLDESTQLPLRNVEVHVANATALTDGEGYVRLTKVKLGRTNLVVQKRAFADIKRPITIGWGSNPLGNTTLKAVGAQYIFNVQDFLSAKKLEKAEATSGEADAISDKNGKIVLTVDASDAAKLDVTVKADGYRDEKLSFDASVKAEQAVKMVPALKHPFISKRSGKYELYKIDVDGKNEELVVKATGSERDDLGLAPHPTSNVTAYVSTRDNVRNKDGFLLSTLLVIDLNDNTIDTVGQSEEMRIVGWSGTKLVYVQIAAGTSASNPKRHRLMAYDYKSNSNKELASSNYFNDVMMNGDTVYYSIASAYQLPGTFGLFKINTDGTNKQNLLSDETWSILRTDYDKLTLTGSNGWYDYKFNDTKPTKLSGEPANQPNRVYSESADHKHSAWVDNRDGKGVLLDYDTSTKTDKILKTQSGLSTPVRWVSNNTLVYRIHTDQETADYVLNIDGGDAKKVRDVTNTAGINQWYFY